MSLRIRTSALVALICFAAGCAQDPEPLNAVKRELADAQDEITKLKAELLRTTTQLHEVQAKFDESETRLFAAAKSKHDAQAQVTEIAAEKAEISQQLQDLEAQREHDALKRHRQMRTSVARPDLSSNAPNSKPAEMPTKGG